MPVAGDAECFRVIERDKIGEHVDKAFKKETLGMQQCKRNETNITLYRGGAQ